MKTGLRQKGWLWTLYTSHRGEDKTAEISEMLHFCKDLIPEIASFVSRDMLSIPPLGYSTVSDVHDATIILVGGRILLTVRSRPFDRHLNLANSLN
jgi:hypothetical protein